MEQPKKPKRGNRDRISSLPDHVLHLIMSSLTAQEAVRLCVLSKRWENLWTTSPFLNFDIKEFDCDIELDDGESDDDESDDGESDDGDSIDYEPKRGICERFKDFVDTTLLRRETSAVDTFRLCWPTMPYFYYNPFLRSWLLYVLRHNPRVLDIHITGKGPLPRNIFSCSSLVSLKLFVFRSRKSIEFVNLPCLRQLHLGLIFIDQDSVDKLLCGCPMLEFLHLQSCHVEFSSIHSQSLKCLKLEGNICKRDEVIEVINAPNLLSFYYTCANYHRCKMLLKTPSLSSASIYVDYWLQKPLYDGKSYILSGITSVKGLEFNGFGILDLLKNERKFPKLPNVKDLRVGTFCLHCHFSLLASFLDHFPMLEKLSLQHGQGYCTRKEHVANKETMHQLQEKLKFAPFQHNGLQIIIESFDLNGVPTSYEVPSGWPREINTQIDLSRDEDGVEIEEASAPPMTYGEFVTRYEQRLL